MNEVVETAEELTEEELEAQFSESDTEETEATEESIETETDTSADDKSALETDTETSDDSTEETVEPTQTAFEKSVLSKTYANEEAAFTALEGAQSRVGQLEREISELRGQKPAPQPEVQKEPEYDKDEWRQKFDDDPVQASKEFNRLYGGAEIKELRQELSFLKATNQLQQVMAEYPDIKGNQTKILEEIQNDPVLWEKYATDPAWAVKQARNNFLANNPPTPPKPEIVSGEVSKDTKEQATTVSKGQPAKRVSTSKEKNWEDMDEEDIERELGVVDDS